MYAVAWKAACNGDIEEKAIKGSDTKGRTYNEQFASRAPVASDAQEANYVPS